MIFNPIDTGSSKQFHQCMPDAADWRPTAFNPLVHRRSSEGTRAGERKERPSLCRVAPKAFRALRSAAKGSAFGNRNFLEKN